MVGMELCGMRGGYVLCVWILLGVHEATTHPYPFLVPQFEAEDPLRSRTVLGWILLCLDFPHEHYSLSTNAGRHEGVMEPTRIHACVYVSVCALCVHAHVPACAFLRVSMASPHAR